MERVLSDFDKKLIDRVLSSQTGITPLLLMYEDFNASQQLVQYIQDTHNLDIQAEYEKFCLQSTFYVQADESKFEEPICDISQLPQYVVESGFQDFVKKKENVIEYEEPDDWCVDPWYYDPDVPMEWQVMRPDTGNHFLSSKELNIEAEKRMRDKGLLDENGMLIRTQRQTVEIDDCCNFDDPMENIEDDALNNIYSDRDEIDDTESDEDESEAPKMKGGNRINNRGTSVIEKVMRSAASDEGRRVLLKRLQEHKFREKKFVVKPQMLKRIHRESEVPSQDEEMNIIKQDDGNFVLTPQNAVASVKLTKLFLKEGWKVRVYDGNTDISIPIDPGVVRLEQDKRGYKCKGVKDRTQAS